MKCTSSGGHSAQIVYPPSKLMYIRHILGMSTSPRNDFCCLKLCCLNCTVITSTPPHPKYRFRGQFFRACKTHTWKFLMSVCSSTPIHVCYFKCGRSQCRMSVRKAGLYWWQKKNSFGTVWRNPWGDFPEFFYASAHCGPTLINQVSFKFVQVWWKYNWKTLLWPPKWKQTGVFEPIINSVCVYVSFIWTVNICTCRF